jgi:hypothetical protein
LDWFGICIQVAEAVSSCMMATCLLMFSICLMDPVSMSVQWTICPQVGLIVVECMKVLNFHQMQPDFFLWSSSPSKLDGVVESKMSYSLLGILLTSCDPFLHASSWNCGLGLSVLDLVPTCCQLHLVFALMFQVEWIPS